MRTGHGRWLAAGLAGWVMVVAALAVRAQDAASQAAAAADRDAAEERYQRLNSAVETLLQTQAQQQRRIEALADELRKLDAQASKPETPPVTREELTRLAETVREIDRKREADKKQILEELGNLGRTLTTATKEREPAKRAASGSSSGGSGESKPEVKPEAKPEARSGGAAGSEEGVWYVVEKGNTLSAIVAAHNEQFRKQGRKTSIKLVQEANPKMKPTVLIVGQKLWIPLVPDKS